MRWINLRQVVWLFALLVLFSPNIALAGLQPTFSVPLEANQIDLFWAGDANLPSDGTGRAVSGDPGSALNETSPSKPGATPPSSLYFFWSGPTPVASQTNYIRIWNTNNRSRADGSLYTALWGGAGNNGYMSMATVPGGITVTYSYIKANAGPGRILSYDEANTSVIGPPPATSRRVVFSAEQPTSSGYNVQIKEVQWRVITPDRGTLTLDGDGGSPLTLTLRNDTYRMNPGDVYRVYFKYKSYWGDWGAESPELIYTVGAGPTGGAGGGVYNLGINFGATDPNIILAWKATGGISDFDIYYTNGDPTLGPWTAVSPKPTFTSAIPPGDTTLTYTTADFSVAGDKVYYRVVPAGADIATSPREVAGKIVYTLRGSTVTATGVNSFALPFSSNWVKDPTAGTTIYLGNGATARASLSSNFEFVGGWDIGAQRDSGVLLGDSTAAATAFNIEVGRGYQIGVTTTDPSGAVSWPVIGIK